MTSVACKIDEVGKAPVNKQVYFCANVIPPDGLYFYEEELTLAGFLDLTNLMFPVKQVVTSAQQCYLKKTTMTMHKQVLFTP